jgi:hypothetical protein
MRAVSFFGPGDEADNELDNGLKAADPASDAAGGTGVGGLGINGGEDGGGTPAPDEGAAGFGGKNGGGETRAAGGGGKGVWARGGRGAAGVPGAVGGPGAGAFGLGEATSLDGGRAGKFIRTVSPAALPVPVGSLPGCGGKLMRTVSFLGSFGSAMRHSKRSYNVA